MVLVAGAGAVGTILSAYLAMARQPVKLLIRERDVPLFQDARELRVDRIGGPPLVTHKPQLTTSLDPAGTAYLLICVKFPDLERLLDAVHAAAPGGLPAGLTLVSTLNGVGAVRRIRERFPAHPVVAMTIMFNGQLLEPLHARITTRPHVLIGSDDEPLLGLFGDSGMQVTRARGEAAAWGKLLINLANAVCALTHTTFRDLLTLPDMRAVYAALLDEAARVFDHAGIAYQLPLPHRAYRQLLLHGGPVPWWLARARNGLQDGSYPSMVADVEAGRPTEVGQLNGEIVCLGLEHKVATPLNARIVSLVQQVEGHAPPAYLTPAELRARLGV